MAYRLGVDVGGTFTDLFLVNDEDGTQHRVKTPSTPSDPSQGVLNGVTRICETAGITPAALGNIVLPLMLGASRKRMIGALDNEAPVAARLGGSLALALKGAEAGVQLLRVHDVSATVQALRVWRGLRDRALVGG